MPKKGDILKFKNYYKGEKVPITIYADIESLIKSLQTCDPNPEKKYTKNTKSVNHLVFPIILSALMIMYLNQD